MAYGTSSSGRVRSELRSWRPRTASGSLRTPGESTLAPRSSNATDFSSYASKDRVLRTYGSRVALTTAEDDDGGSPRLEIGGFHLRKRDVCGNANRDDGREGLF